MQVDARPTDAQKDEAALWHVKRAGGSLTAAQEQEFDVWLNADTGNRLAYDQMRVLWAQVEEPASRLVASHAGQMSVWRRAMDWFSPLRTVVSCSAVAAAIAVGVFLNPDALDNLQADIVTDTKTVSEIRLPDGSTVFLAANSAMTTDFDDGHREIELLRGQAFFDVVHRDGDSFRVQAGPATVEVVGTRFNIDFLTEDTQVGVEEGAVRVSTQHQKDSVMLGPGDVVAVSGGNLMPRQAVDIASVQSWMNGRLSVQNIPLDDLIARLDNFAPGRLMVLGDIGNKTVSGSFPTDDVARSLETLAFAVDGTVVRTSPWLTVVY
ncbi:FecR domain-containing protein [Thalassospira sp.]|uniref:FecR family protein n=1 Tax=Thalassospira sp. TaxID=1912094 RepID=UPI000C50C87F|nr:FecR domain-containing protein [Thalassospira sp.]MBC06963.1 iron dicitrate transport regulator FecR [Thalassospira sp.]|tara:strand:- start:699 stop:1664 length:966 start_codon:yes stop_codon:yes gene_type:complete